MREILFRGKRTDNGKWVEGAFCPKNCDLPFGPMVDRPSIIKLDEPCSGFWADVIAETVCQYTGLTDKNGTKIFEGDICEDASGTAFVVEWDAEDARFLGRTIGGLNKRERIVEPRKIVYVGREPRVEVIGNTHDNPELLGGADNGE